MNKKLPFNSHALQYVYDRYIGSDRKLADEFEEELAAADVASRIYKLRSRSRPSQRQLADKGKIKVD